MDDTPSLPANKGVLFMINSKLGRPQDTGAREMPGGSADADSRSSR